MFQEELQPAAPVPLGNRFLRSNPCLTRMLPVKLFFTIAGIIWASPNTLLGLLIGTVGLLFGGRVRRMGRAIEFYDGGIKWLVHRLPNGQFTL